MLHQDLNEQKQSIVTALNKLPSSINTFDRAVRKEQIRKVQEALDQQDITLTDNELQTLKKELAAKNYLLEYKNSKWVLMDRDIAFETSYADRFKYYLQYSNDKAKCTESLEDFMTNLCQLSTYSELINKTGINLIDIGAGDGCVALPIMKLLNKANKAKYIAIERDSKFVPIIEKKFETDKISCTVYPNDIRKILEKLANDQPSIALVSHLYLPTKMTEFLPLVFKTLVKNGVIILAHESNVTDAVKFRSKHANVLLSRKTDCTDEIADAFNMLELDNINTTYESSLKFPILKEEEWKQLYQIKQADYNNDYQSLSDNFKIAKNLIDFVISSKLEAFSDEERKVILDDFQKMLTENNYQLKSTCKIQVALSPNHTLECKAQFKQLKDKIENVNTKQDEKATLSNTKSSLAYSGSLFASSVTEKQGDQVKMDYNNLICMSQNDIVVKPEIIKLLKLTAQKSNIDEIKDSP